MAKFLSGTEGTLALTLGATVRLVDAPRATALAVLGYPDMPAAAEAVPALLPHLPVALEGLDSRMVDVFRDPPRPGRGARPAARRRLAVRRDVGRDGRGGGRRGAQAGRRRRRAWTAR